MVYLERMFFVKEFIEHINFYEEQFDKIYNNENSNKDKAMPGNTYFLDDGSILSIPRSDGDNRFPYGEQGFNFWTYASGYMHANEGLFSPFLRANEGQEPKIAFFAGWKGQEKYEVLSLMAVPKLEEDCIDEIIRYTVFTKVYTYYITKAKEMRFTVRVFVDEGKHMYFSIMIQNLSNHKQELYVSTYLNPFLCNKIYETSESRWFRKAEFIESASTDTGHFIFSINEDLSRTVSVTNFGVINRSLTLEGDSLLLKQEATTSRYQYVGGAYSSLHTAASLKQGYFQGVKHVTSFNDTAIAGEIIHLEVAPKKLVQMDMEFSYVVHSDNSEGYQALHRKVEPALIEDLVNSCINKNNSENTSLKGIFGEAVHDDYNGKIITTFFDYLKKQVEFCSLIKGYVQLSEGSLIGIRDVFQAIEGMLYFKPEQARIKILEALGFIAPNGRCPRQYTLPINDKTNPIMDLRQFIDQGVWVINTIVTYLKFTGDFTILEELCGYYEIVDEKLKIVHKSDLKDNVLSHMLRIMDYLLQSKDLVTGCIRTLYGDWNDALDGLGVSRDGKEEFGSGVSVMVTLQVYQNLQEMIELLGLLEGYEQTRITYTKALEDIEKALKKQAIIIHENGEQRIVHGWGDQQSYYVGGFTDPDGKSRYGLTSNAFWVISGLYRTDTSIKNTILLAFDHLDSKYGLKTFEPYFSQNTPGVGRIYKLPPGTAENGAAYIHATAFGIMALFMMGEPKRAWIQLRKIFPFTHQQISCSPYVMPNSYGDNTALNINGESMQDWQTGSSNVVLKIIIRFIFGFQPEYGGFLLQPASWIPFNTYLLDIVYQGTLIHISYNNKKAGKRSFMVNNNMLLGIYDEYLGTDKLWIEKHNLGDVLDIIIED
ncbi:MAG: hypothetical protein K0S01_2265 [Herbinix sp.]|jgi:hypothetical protein|nr:hypothetical protein [Herbinix sp.]